MRKIARKAKNIGGKSARIIRSEGPVKFAKRGTKFAYRRLTEDKDRKIYRDILFVNGCSLPHPSRYRVDHQLEQLRSHGLTADSVYYENLDVSMLKYYRGFVFFRCPITDTVKEFIGQAKSVNKTCFFDIDDLVIDDKYTNLIKYVQEMPQSEKSQYDDGVRRMRETLELCDFAITTTERLQKELGNYIGEVFINRNVASDEMIGRSNSAIKEYDLSKSKDDRVVIGYFSGSITHNEDFELVLPSIVRLLEKHKNLYIKVAGILDVPKELEPFKDRIISIKFMDWRSVPGEIIACDINLAPLTDSIFNEAKSENKWTEAALVGVVTAASNVGAFKKVIKNNKTGILVDDGNWFEALNSLIENKDLRLSLGMAARDEVLKNHTTIGSGRPVAEYIKSKLAPNIGFILPSTDISGGVNVVIKHADILQNNGWDVTLIDGVDKSYHNKAMRDYDYRNTIPGHNVVTGYNTEIEAGFNVMVATLWSTVKDLKKQTNAKRRLYFVQSMETGFYVPGLTQPRVEANATYCDDSGIEYVTMSLWCKKWLKEDFGKDSKYASNGIELKNYPFRKRNFGSSKIRILIEGDSSSEYKNTDEAFRIVEKLDPQKYEISYLSYRDEKKDWYRVDHSYNRIPPEEVGKVFAKSDILIKTSILESFSYPPLEMMATGGVSVVLPNGGNIEYLRDGENCLFYEKDNIEDGAKKVEMIVNNKELREKLISGGLKTAKAYQWEKLEDSIVGLYS